MTKPAIALFRKDLRVTRILWAPMAFSYFVFLLAFMENVWIYLATGACLTFVMAATAMGIDDRHGTEPLFAALPGTRRGLVKGKYLSWGAFTAAGLGIFLVSTALLVAALGERSPRLASLLSVKGAAAFLAGTALTGLVFLPFHFRLGFWRGIWGVTAAGFCLSLASLNALAAVVPAGRYGAASATALPGLFGSTGRGLRALAWLIDGFMGKPAVMAAAGGILALLTALSYRLSVRFYEKRDL